MFKRKASRVDPEAYRWLSGLLEGYTDDPEALRRVRVTPARTVRSRLLAANEHVHVTRVGDGLAPATSTSPREIVAVVLVRITDPNKLIRTVNGFQLLLNVAGTVV